MRLTFITGNQHKADFLAHTLGIPVERKDIDLDEIQSLNLLEVVEHKAQSGSKLTEGPVLVEDISLILHGLGNLPGPLIKWFIKELGNDGLATLAQTLDNQKATATIMYGLIDDKGFHTFEGHTDGRISPTQRGTDGFGFQDIFIPDGTDKTFAEMSEKEMLPFYHRIKAINKLRAYLQAQNL